VAKFRLSLTYEYEVPDEEIEETYETSDLHEAAETDRQNLLDDPGSLDLLTDGHPPIAVTIVPVEGS